MSPDATDPRRGSHLIDEVLPDALDGERLDRVVAMLDGCSRSVAAALIADGGVQLDGELVSQRSFRVAAGMRVSFAATDKRVAELAADAGVDFGVVYADDDLVVVDKPAGVVVHPGAGRPGGTLVNGLLARFPDIRGVGESARPGIVHRLDGDTSGLLVVARTDEAYRSLVEALSRHQVERVYATVVAGVVTDDRGVIDAPIGRSAQRRTRMAVVADGREARTHYDVLSRRHDDPAATRLRCRLETGRTHQIRVHLAAIGHPVLGDPTYGSPTSRRGFERVALHAERLAFVHPRTGDALDLEAPLPPDFVELLSQLSLG